MGLAGRKEKQRIPKDPRNLSWADDASRFGLSYLSKFGWDTSQGLGSSGDGITTHLKVQQKLDMMGIGAQHQRDPNGIAWKQNKDFEALLKRLNESAGQAEEVDGNQVRETPTEKAFIRAHGDSERAEGKSKNELSVTTKKRKHDGNDTDPIQNTGKKMKKEKSCPDETSEHSEPAVKARPMAHRARIRAAKRMTGKSLSAVSEILGIAPSSSVSPLPSTPAPATPSSSSPTDEPSLSIDNLTKSAKSIADYFKEKLLPRSSESLAPSGSCTPNSNTSGLGLGSSNLSPRDEVESPRRGIGSRTPAIQQPSHVPESPASGDDDSIDGRDMLTEKQRRKAERKARKQKQREREASQCPEDVDVSISVEEQDSKMAKEMSKERKRRKRKHEASTGGSSTITEKKQEHDTRSGSLAEPHEKSQKERKKKHLHEH